MGRPIKQGLIYFPLDSDFFTNKKIKALRRAHGSIGILTYLNILCRVYRNGYYYKFDSIDELAMDIAEEIACEQIRKTATCVTESIHYLVEQGILAEESFKQDVITGEALQEQYVLSAYKAKRNIHMDVHCLVDVNLVMQKNRIISEKTPVSSEETPVSSKESTQSKSKYKTNKHTYTDKQTEHDIKDAVESSSSVPPDECAVMFYMQNVLFVKNAQIQAKLFISYNNERGWDCLPNWREAACRWAANIN